MTSVLAEHLAASLDPVTLALRLGWVPDPWQATALRSSEQWLALNVHRQGGKSQVAAVKAVHTAVHEPGSLVVMVSPSQRQSSELFRRAMVVYRALGRPVDVEAENLSRVELENGSRIIAVPGDPDTVRGLSAVRLLIADEASRISDDLFTAVQPMLGVSRGQLLAVSTPWGRRGWWWRACTDPLLGWSVTTVPATECVRISPGFLAQARASMTPVEFASEYMVEFVEGAGSLFDVGDVDRMFTPGELFDPMRPIRSLHLVREANA